VVPPVAVTPVVFSVSSVVLPAAPSPIIIIAVSVKATHSSPQQTLSPDRRQVSDLSLPPEFKAGHKTAATSP
jgi:hypothetical protein